MLYELKAISTDRSGAVFDFSLYDEYSVEWSASVEGGLDLGILTAFYPQNETPTNFLVTLPEPLTAPTPVDVTATVTWDGGSISAIGRLTLAPPVIPGPNADQITSNLSKPVGVFLNSCSLLASDGSRPKVFWELHEFFGTVDLPKNLSEESCTRDTKAELSVFSSEYQPVVFSEEPFSSKTTAQMIWTDVIGDQLLADDHGWSSPDRIDADLRAFASGSTWMANVTHANDLFEERRAGIEFNVTEKAAIAGVCDGALKRDCSPNYLKDCLKIPIDEARLNVVYLEDLGGPHGYTCSPEEFPSVISRVVFVSEDDKYEETLAHEFGHVMGHRWPFICWQLGHVNKDVHAGFSNENLMHDRTHLTPQRTVLTLGQVFRMIVDDGSWYQVETGFDPTISNRIEGWNCSNEPYDGGACPQIHRDPEPSIGRIAASAIAFYCPSGGA